MIRVKKEGLLEFSGKDYKSVREYADKYGLTFREVVLLALLNSVIEYRKRRLWHWPYLRHSDGPELSCRHGVGHSEGVHGCEGCCSDPMFKKAVTKWKAKKS